MRTIVATVEPAGAVSIPEEVRRHLKIEAEGTVTFVITDDGRVELRRSPDDLIESLRGAAGTHVEPRAWEEMERILVEDRAERIAAKLGLRPAP